MTNLGQASKLNINNNIILFKDENLTSTVEEIIEAISTNNTEIGNHINDLNDRLETIENTSYANVQSDWEAISGDGLILNKPSIPSKTSDLTNDSNFATTSDISIAIADLVDSAPETLNTLAELSAALNDDANFASTIATQLGQKQATLVSGTNIKTINNESLLGSGNISITSNVTSVNGQTGSVTISIPSNTSELTNDSGFLTSHQDITGKQDTLVSGTSIKTINGESLLGSGNISISSGSSSGLPSVTSSDNGKILMVVEGEWALTNPIRLYSGSGVPNNNTGNNGDLYIQV